MLQRQHDLDQAGDAGRGFEMSDVGLRRAHQQRPVRVPAGAVGGRGRLHLDRVPERGTGAMRLQVVDVAAAESGAGQSRVDKTLLRTTIGDGQATGGTVLVDRGAADDGGDAVAVALRIAEPLEDQDATTFTADVAVGGRIERLAAAVGRQHPRAGRRDDGRRAQQHVDATGQGHIAVARMQGLHGLVDRHQ
ncbi:hypothetical protein MAUB1S_11643 [Mycolicibacterium aubagnense]